MTTSEFQSLSHGTLLQGDDMGAAIVVSDVYYQNSEYRADVTMSVGFEPITVTGLTARDLADYHVTHQRVRT